MDDRDDQQEASAESIKLLRTTSKCTSLAVLQLRLRLLPLRLQRRHQGKTDRITSSTRASVLTNSNSYKPSPPKPSPPKPKGLGLADAMLQRGRVFHGTALTLRGDDQELAIVNNKHDFNSITPENSMKWESIEPSRNNFTFQDADRYAEYARKEHKQIHCHNLVWHSQLPEWVSNGGFDNATLIGIMKNHITKLAGRYRDVCTRWDVVNEALNENGTYRSSVWYDTIGEAFLPIAFRFASEVAPNAELYYNDYNLEYNNDKTAGAKRIVELVQSYGIKINGVGFQAHLTSEPTGTSADITPSQLGLETALTTMTDLGVDVVYTEIDIRMNTPATPEKVEAQKAAYERVSRSCLGVKRCIGMTVWGVSDKYSWIPETFPGEGSANL